MQVDGLILAGGKSSRMGSNIASKAFVKLDNKPLIEQKLLNLSLTLRNYYKEKNIRIKKLQLTNQQISFSVDAEYNEQILDEFTSEESTINPYYPRFKSNQFNIDQKNDLFYLSYSRQGLVELKTSSQDQALEIVRRRVDEVGTNEPIFLKEATIEY